MIFKIIIILYITASIARGEAFNEVIERFLSSKLYKSLVVCSMLNDHQYENMIQASVHHQVAIVQCNCNEIPFTTKDNLIIFVRPEITSIKEILAKSGAQKYLSANTLIIFSDESPMDVSKYFQQKVLKLGLNAKVFHVNSESSSLFQVIGSGTETVQIKVIVKRLFDW